MDTMHTATPWAVTVGGVITSGDDLLSGIKLISPWIEDAWDDDPEALANSALIVQAVNAHADLVNALQTFTDLCSCVQPLANSVNVEKVTDVKRAMKFMAAVENAQDVLAALAKARVTV